MKSTYKFSYIFTLLVLLSGSFFNAKGNESLNCEMFDNYDDKLSSENVIILQTLKSKCIKKEKEYDEEGKGLDQQCEEIRKKCCDSHQDPGDEIRKKQLKFNKKIRAAKIEFLEEKKKITQLTEGEKCRLLDAKIYALAEILHEETKKLDDLIQKRNAKYCQVTQDLAKPVLMNIILMHRGITELISQNKNPD